MKELRRTLLLVAIFAAVFLLYHGIPLGVVEERVTVVGMATLTISPPQGQQDGWARRLYDLKLENGEIIRVTAERSSINDGYVYLERRYSPIRFRMFYSLASE